jgi:hypothetical protein
MHLQWDTDSAGHNVGGEKFSGSTKTETSSGDQPAYSLAKSC